MYHIQEHTYVMSNCQIWKDHQICNPKVEPDTTTISMLYGYTKSSFYVHYLLSKPVNGTFKTSK